MGPYTNGALHVRATSAASVSGAARSARPGPPVRGSRRTRAASRRNRSRSRSRPRHCPRVPFAERRIPGTTVPDTTASANGSRPRVLRLIHRFEDVDSGLPAWNLAGASIGSGHRDGVAPGGASVATERPPEAAESEPGSPGRAIEPDALVDPGEAPDRSYGSRA